MLLSIVFNCKINLQKPLIFSSVFKDFVIFY